ncbi:MAG: HAD-IIIA family hydrolase [bacterium]|nr:HAD-IIIA family hydrolase [bacterium]
MNPEVTEPVQHIVLDRDGVLNRENPSGGWVTQPDQWVWEEGARSALVLASSAGIKLSIVSNQSCIGRGVATIAAIDAVNQRMVREAEEAGASIERVLICPHAPDDACECRKPAPGLILEAVRESGVSVAHTVMVGDAERDIEAAHRAGITAILVRTGKGRDTEASLAIAGIDVFDDLKAAVQALVAKE